MSAQRGVDTHSIVGRAVQRELEAAEESRGPTDGVRDKLELAQSALPVFSGYTLGAAEIGEGLCQCGLAVWGQLDGLSQGVHDPAQY